MSLIAEDLAAWAAALSPTPEGERLAAAALPDTLAVAVAAVARPAVAAVGARVEADVSPGGEALLSGAVEIEVDGAVARLEAPAALVAATWADAWDVTISLIEHIADRS